MNERNVEPEEELEEVYFLNPGVVVIKTARESNPTPGKG